MMSPHKSCDLWQLWQTVAVDLGLNYKAGTAEPELPYKAAIAFDDPRLAGNGTPTIAGKFTQTIPIRTKPYSAMPIAQPS